MCHALLGHSVAVLIAQQIQGATVCPTPDQVRTHLRALVRDEGAAGTIGRLTDEPRGVRFSLDDADGRRLGERLLPPSPASAARWAVGRGGISVGGAGRSRSWGSQTDDHLTPEQRADRDHARERRRRPRGGKPREPRSDTTDEDAPGEKEAGT